MRCLRHLVPWVTLDHVLQHRHSERTHVAALFGKVESQVVEICGREILVSAKALDKTLSVVVDERTKHLEAEIITARRWRELLGIQSQRRDSEQISPFGVNQVILPKECQVSSDTTPLVATSSPLQCPGLLVHHAAKRLRINGPDKLKKRCVVRVVLFVEVQKTLARLADVLFLRRERKIPQHRVHSLSDFDISSLHQETEEAVDPRWKLLERLLGGLSNAEAIVTKKRQNCLRNFGPVTVFQPAKDVNVHRKMW